MISSGRWSVFEGHDQFWEVVGIVEVVGAKGGSQFLGCPPVGDICIGFSWYFCVKHVGLCISANCLQL